MGFEDARIIQSLLCCWPETLIDPDAKTMAPNTMAHTINAVGRVTGNCFIFEYS